MITWAMVMIDLTIGKDGKMVNRYLTTLEAIKRASLPSPMTAKIQTATGAMEPSNKWFNCFKVSKLLNSCAGKWTCLIGLSMVCSLRFPYLVKLAPALISYQQGNADWVSPFSNLESAPQSQMRALEIFFKMGQPRLLFVYFRSFQTQILWKTVGVSEIWTRIDGVEGKHSDHLTTTTARTHKLKIACIMTRIVICDHSLIISSTTCRAGAKLKLVRKMCSFNQTCPSK